MRQLIWITISDPHAAPSTCGVYQYWSGSNLLYIGKAINIKARLLSHAQNAKLDAKEAAIVAGDLIKYTPCDTEFKALLLESELIRTHHPPHNRVWKDDKSYLYIAIDLADPYPRPRLVRAHELDLKSRVFGPFPSGKIAEEVLRSIRHLIPFCMTKKIGQRPCLYSHIGLCSPCPAAIQKLTYPVCDIKKRQYRHQIRQVIKILEGHIDPIIKDLTIQMMNASDREDFETALTLRTKIERFERFITTHSFTDRHFSYNDSATKLIALQTLLIPYLGTISLHRIECYDASNSGLQDSTVALVALTEGLLDHGQYRRFKIKNPRAISDFDRLDEALSRRLKNSTWPQPNLVVIDGGTPQLRRLQRVFDRLPHPPLYLGFAKHPDRLVIPHDNSFVTVKVDPSSPALHLLAQLRDEAHRFANNYRKFLGSKRTGI